jgi:hypothetical protein
MVLIKMDSSTTSQPGEDFEITFNNFELDKNIEYEIALLKSSIWYSYHNISSEFSNNVLRYRTAPAASWNTVNFDNGIYSITDINNTLQAKMKADGNYSVVGGLDTFSISISPNYTTLRAVVSISGTYALDFTQSNLHELLGFTSIVVSTTQSGANNADITRGVNSLVIKNSLVKNSYDNGLDSSIIFSFVPNVSPGALMDISPNVPIYLDINRRNHIESMRFTLHDNQNRLVKLNGEHTFSLYDLREKK